MAVQEVKMGLDELGYKVHGQKVELDLLLERLNSLEKEVSQLSRKMPSPLESRLTALEKAHKTLISDFQSLKNHIDATNTTLAKCQKQLSEIDSKLSGDIKSLKGTLNSMLALLQDGEELYTVKPGDSLGQIALEHKTTTRALKELNQLSSDRIIVGQKLRTK